jgi:predicted small integral membrane protein
MTIRLSAFSRFVLLFGLAAWLTIAAFNNLTDSQTNRLLLGQTLSMEMVKTEPVLGSGLTWRAWPAQWSQYILYGIVIVQFFIAGLLWYAAASYARATVQNSIQTLVKARGRAILALTCFLMIWLFFVCGGMWFGYWLKQGVIQSVHMTLILITLASLLYVQSDSTTVDTFNE